MKVEALRTIGMLLVALLGCGGAQTGGASSADREPNGTPAEYEGRIADLCARLDLALGHPPSQLAAGESEVLRDAEGEDEPIEEYKPAPHPASEPDCDLAADLRNRVCDLAARICRSAAGREDDAKLQGMCERATARCEDARRDVTVNCD